MISVIIPTYNDQLDLKNCIESLGNQTFNDFEIIVVDDGSTDATVEILENLQKSINNFKFLKQNHGGAGEARNLGVSSAKGKILVFVDADMTFDEGFLKNLVKPIELGLTKGTFSKEEFVSNWSNIWSRCWNINEGWESKRRHPKNYPEFQPVFRAILKSEFEKVGGFVPGGYNDDWSLFQSLGYMAQAAPDAIFFHKNPENLIEVFKHAKWVAKRKYKMGVIGYLAALIRVSFPISIIIGIYKSIAYQFLPFLIFKIVYDLGAFVGILDFVVSGKGAK